MPVPGMLPMVSTLARQGHRRVAVPDGECGRGAHGRGRRRSSASTASMTWPGSWPVRGVGRPAPLDAGRRCASPAPGTRCGSDGRRPGRDDPRDRTRSCRRPTWRMCAASRMARWALEVALAGGHDLLLVGSPGAGKTLLARTVPGLLPPLDDREAQEVAVIRSVAGLRPDAAERRVRPFRSPHHTTSYAAMVGGGPLLQPGLVTLAHRGRAVPRRAGGVRPERPGCAAPAARGRHGGDRPRPRTRALSGPAPAHRGDEPVPVRLVRRTGDGPVDAARMRPAQLPATGQRPAARPHRPAGRHGRVPPRCSSKGPAGEPSSVVAARIARARAVALARARACPMRGCRAGRSWTPAAGARPQAGCSTELSTSAGMTARGIHRALRVARTIADLAGDERVGAAGGLGRGRAPRGRPRRMSGRVTVPSCRPANGQRGSRWPRSTAWASAWCPGWRRRSVARRSCWKLLDALDPASFGRRSYGCGGRPGCDRRPSTPSGPPHATRRRSGRRLRDDGRVGPGALGPGLPAGVAGHRPAAAGAVRGRATPPRSRQSRWWRSSAPGARRRWVVPWRVRVAAALASARRHRRERPGRRHRRSRPCRHARGRGAHGGRHRRRTGPRRAAGACRPGGRHPRRGWCHRGGASARHAADPRHLPASQPHHQRAEPGHRGHRGTHRQRGAHHRAACPGAGSGRVRGARPAVGPGHGGLPRPAAGDARRGRSWVSTSCSSTWAWTGGPGPGATAPVQPVDRPGRHARRRCPVGAGARRAGHRRGCCSTARSRPTRWSSRDRAVGRRRRRRPDPAPAARLGGPDGAAAGRGGAAADAGAAPNGRPGPDRTLHERTAP